MNPAELRIGNAVFKKYEGQMIESVITCNDFFDRSTEHPEGFCPIQKYPDNYAPIELTKQTLIRLGFSEENKPGYDAFRGCAFIRQEGKLLLFCILLKKGAMVCVLNMQTDETITDLCRIDSVSEFQNVCFVFTKKEIELKPI